MARSVVYARRAVTPYAASAVALRNAYQVGKYLGRKVASYAKGSQNKTASKSVISSGPITTQHDVSLRYRRKSMPRRKRKAWKSFTNKVKHVMLQMNSLTSFTSDNLRSNFTTTTNQQTVFGVYLGGTGASNNDELLAAFKAAYSSALSSSTVDDYKLFIKSMCLDVQLSNTGSNGIILDVYELIARKADNASSETIGNMYSRLYNEQTVGALGSLLPDSPSSTPFQNALFLQKWKIMKKKEILLGSGQVTTMQMRVPYNRTLQGKTIESNPSYIPGVTRAYLFQARGVPVNSAGTVNAAAIDISMCCQHTVTFGIPPGSQRSTASDL